MMIPNSSPVPPARAIAIASGKGGVGKSTTAIAVSIAMAQMGRRVVLFDADLGLANIDVLLGLKGRYDISHVLSGEVPLNEVILEGPAGISVIPGGSGLAGLASASDRERAGLIHALSDVADATDVLIVDTPAGIGPNTLQFCSASQEVVVVVCDDPASLTDAYALIKVLNQDAGRDRFRVIVNMATSESHGKLLFRRLVATTSRFLDVSVDLAGVVPYDAEVVNWARRQKSVLTGQPLAPVSQAFKKVAQMSDNWPRPRGAQGQLEFFLESLIQAQVTGRHASA